MRARDDREFPGAVGVGLGRTARNVIGCSLPNLTSVRAVLERTLNEPFEPEFGADRDARADAPRDRTASGVNQVRTVGSISLVVGTAAERVLDPDPFDDKHLLLDDNVAFCLSEEPILARIDSARLQRAAECARQSTGCSGDDVVERRRMLGILAGDGPVVLTDLVMGSEDDGMPLGGEVRLADRPPFPFDSNL